jgi:hypothetical protein
VVASLLGGQSSDAQNASSPSFLGNSNVNVTYSNPSKSVILSEEKIMDARKWLEEKQVLERFAQLLSPLKLPRKLTVLAKTCNQPNAFYNHKEASIIICYELIPYVRLVAQKQQFLAATEGASNLVTKNTIVAKDDVEVGGLAFVVLHEIGHAVFHIFGLPIFGRNEDAADQFAAYVALRFSPPMAQRMIKGGAAYTVSMAADPKALADFADEHGSPTQRFANIFCLAYGYDPVAYSYIVAPQLLPEARARSCAQEYRQVENAFRTTLGPHLDKDKAETLRSRGESLAGGFK